MSLKRNSFSSPENSFDCRGRCQHISDMYQVVIMVFSPCWCPCSFSFYEKASRATNTVKDPLAEISQMTAVQTEKLRVLWASPFCQCLDLVSRLGLHSGALWELQCFSSPGCPVRHLLAHRLRRLAKHTGKEVVQISRPPAFPQREKHVRGSLDAARQCWGPGASLTCSFHRANMAPECHSGRCW